MIEPTWTSEDGSIVLYRGDCLEVLPTMEAGSVDAVVTDPPYKTNASGVPQRGRGVGKRRHETYSVGQPWGYSTDWVEAIRPLEPDHWVTFLNYAMLGEFCTALPPSAVMVWRKSNAPRMARPIPRMDCEFILWSRSPSATCGRMGEFKSLVIDVPMPQAGCFATERILIDGTGKAAHPCQKPIAVVQPFIDRLPIDSVLDPFMGTGTTGVACVRTGRRFIGIEIDEKYFEIAKDRIQAAIRERSEQLIPA